MTGTSKEAVDRILMAQTGSRSEGMIRALAAERDELQAKLDVATKDAARYQYLRNRDVDAIKKGGVFAGMTPQNVLLSHEHLDLAVDIEIRQALSAIKEGE